MRRSALESGKERSPFGALLRQFRLAKGLSQEALAERARLSVEAISALERGSRKAPQRQTLALLIDGLALDSESAARLESLARRPSAADVYAPASAADTHPAARRHNLSRPLTRFIDRVEERATLAQMLAAHRVVTLTGPGGVGKTRIAVELCFDVLDRYADGVWFVDLAALDDGTLVLQEIASALDIREVPSRPLLDVIVATLQDRDLLIVVDNCEHVIEDAARAIEALVSRCAHVRVLATSRESLRIDGERTYRVPVLAAPADGTVLDAGDAAAFGAVELFVERGSALDPRFALTADNRDAVATICRRLDGLPLALELAAAAIPAFGVGQIAERLDQRFRLLTSGRRTALPRQRTLHALIDWSFDLLTPRERLVFTRLAILAGQWTLDAAIAVCTGGPIASDDVPELLISLVEKSLVVAEIGGDEHRFSLLESTHAYAAEKLDAAGERPDVARRHAAYVRTFALEAGALVKQRPQRTWLGMVEREIENVRAALHWTIDERNDFAAGAEIVTSLGTFWDLRRYHEGTRWLIAMQGLIDNLEPLLAAKVLMETARVMPFSTITLDRVQAAVARYRSVPDVPERREALIYLGQTLINTGDYVEAERAFHEGLELARAARDEVAAARLLVLIGVSHTYRAHVTTARRFFAEAEALIAADRSDGDVALLRRCQGETEQVAGNAARAAELLEESLAILQRLGDPRRSAYAHYHLAHALLAAGRVGDAIPHAQRAARELLDAQLPLAFLESLIVAAAVAQQTGDDLRAAALLGFVEARAPHLAFRSALLISGLQARTRAALAQRLSPADLQNALARGALFDDQEAAQAAQGS